jgi:hypothetical protein
MEADWSVALAAGDPVIIVPWAAPDDDVNQCRFVDLRKNLHRIDEIEEARAKPSLRSALLLLNGAGSQFWTAKCDTWNRSAIEGDEAYDPYEMDTEPQETRFGTGSYIDLLPREARLLASFECQERWMRAVVERLRHIAAKAVRVELVLRHAEIEAVSGFGVTWFVEGCGATAHRAEQRWSEALDLALAVTTEARLQLRCRADDDTMAKTGE